MAYEGQIAGVGDRLPGKPLRSAAIRAMQARSERDIHSRLPADRRRGARGRRRRRRARVRQRRRHRAASRAPRPPGSSPSSPPARASTRRRCSTTTARSTLEPAAFFCLPVVRRPVGGVATLLGGGYLASGPATPDRLPEPYLPGGLRFDRQEGAGEVQTPAARRRGLRAPSRRPGLPAPREGGRALRALRLALPGRGRADRRRGPHIPRRGQGVSLMARIDLDKIAHRTDRRGVRAAHRSRLLHAVSGGSRRRSSCARERRTATGSAPCGGSSPGRCASRRRSRRSSGQRGWTT